MPSESIDVEVCYARGSLVFLQAVCVPAAPEIDLATCRVGLYGKLKSLDTALRDHDRIEIYRGLLADPKDARRKRVKRK
jgi:putative ubiquitin-RnfH superfamily antitoxin RatB of RatAB toxin-antitoxin module